jgi:protein involved in sex pheromone biosynthesis
MKKILFLSIEMSILFLPACNNKEEEKEDNEEKQTK